jgi:hypothetical protein
MRRAFAFALAAAAALAAGPAQAVSEGVAEAVCRQVEAAAGLHGLPVAFLTRLIWRESSFRASVTSPAGAQGIAQFMPGTARERGLQDPFDPEQAIPAAASLLADLQKRFGNLGLAAAAYNGGPARVEAWLKGQGSLPLETEFYVRWITGRDADEWTEADPPPEGSSVSTEASCLVVLAALNRPSADEIPVGPLAPWGVQVAGNFSKSRAMAAYERARRTFGPIVGDVRPMVIGTRLRWRGTRAFYRVRIPAETRADAERLCQRIRSARGSCIVLAS